MITCTVCLVIGYDDHLRPKDVEIVGTSAPAHPCCVIWQRLEPGKPCAACAESRRLNREHLRHTRRKAAA